MTDYKYVRAAYDYGPRKATLGLCFHGAEAESGVVGYLSRNPARGVSANFVCERSTGRMVRMLPWANASGSMNPRDRSTNKSYYGHDHLVDVLGDYWTDPNAAVISVEIEMYARKGPDQAQVASLIAWAADMKAIFPSIRGAIGHADQTDTKPCPGATPAMRGVFDSIGGHGLWAQTEQSLAIYTRTVQTGRFVIAAGSTVDGYDLSGEAPVKTKTKKWDTESSASFGAVLSRTTNVAPTPLLEVTSGAYQGLYVPTSQVTETFDPPPSPPGATALGPGLYEVK